MAKSMIKDMRWCADRAEKRLAVANAHNTRSAPLLAKLMRDLPPPEPLTDDETAEMIRLLIRSQVWELGETYRDAALAWLDQRSDRRPRAVIEIY
jgi:hypothetical protein